MKKCIFALCLAVLTLLTACGEKSASRSVYAMDTVMNLTIYGGDDALLDKCEQALREIEQTLSRRIETSAVAALNRDGSVTDSVVAALLFEALNVSAATSDAFYPALAQLIDAWGFGTDHQRVPTDEELSQLLEAVKASAFSIEGDTVFLEGEADIDLGGIAKGYAGEVLRALLRKAGTESAVLDLGGDVAVLGSKTDGSDWRIAVKDPADGAQHLGVLSLSDAFVTTSGVYERFFEENGVRYHHILDRDTGKSAESGLVSVTFVCDNGVWADALSTACFVMGVEDSLALRTKYIGRGAELFEMIFVTDDGRVLYTEGLADSFAPSEEGIYSYEIVS